MGRELALRISDLSYTYASQEQPSIKNVNLSIAAGEFVVLLGPSGCGKSTLLRCCSGIVPHLTTGEMQGVVEVCGHSTRDHKLYELAQLVGVVVQNPDDQIFSLNPQDEVSFGPENLGLSKAEIGERVETALAITGLTDKQNALTLTMSGGEKQRLAIASCLSLRPHLMLFDEPTTDLDPSSKEEVIAAIAKLKEEHGMSVLVSEHAITELIQYADRIIAMRDGEIVVEGSPQEVLGGHVELLQELGVRLPGHIQAGHLLKRRGFKMHELPLTTGSLARAVETQMKPASVAQAPVAATNGVAALGQPWIEMRDVWYRHGRERWQAKGINLSFSTGEYVAIVGRNGTGKSTLARLLVGLVRPERGDVVVEGMDTCKTSVGNVCRSLGFLFQNPAHQLFTHRVSEEIMFGLRIAGMDEEEATERTDETLEFIGLTHKREQHPMKLSQGERKRLAAGTVLALRPKGVVLDEPTTGQDGRRLENLLALMNMLNEGGATTILMITHDMEVVARHATRVIGLDEGEVLYDGDPHPLFDDMPLMARLGLRPPETVEVAKHMGRGDLGVPTTAQELVDAIDRHRALVPLSNMEGR